jgi:catechol 2,3-dioxygenase-like lactoylglutathione lyase family enzyme
MALFTRKSAPPISSIVAMIHVSDVERSAQFYRRLGFEIGNRVPARGVPHWAWLYSPAAPDWRRGANLMLARTGRALQPEAQDVLFYLYASNLRALREQLLANGVEAGPIEYPEYLPEGEIRVIDPDGYCLMIAQSTPETP